MSGKLSSTSQRNDINWIPWISVSSSKNESFFHSDKPSVMRNLTIQYFDMIAQSLKLITWNPLLHQNFHSSSAGLFQNFSHHRFYLALVSMCCLVASCSSSCFPVDKQVSNHESQSHRWGLRALLHLFMRKGLRYPISIWILHLPPLKISLFSASRHISMSLVSPSGVLVLKFPWLAASKVAWYVQSRPLKKILSCWISEKPWCGQSHS